MSWNELMTRCRDRGFVTYADADACGVSRDSLRHRADREGWERPYRGMFVPAARPLSPDERIAAAYASVRGPRAVAGDAALYLHGLLTVAPTVTDLLVPLTNRGADLGKRRIRRTKLLRREDLVPLDGMLVVSAAWAIHAVARDRSIDALRYLAIDARFRKLLVIEDLADVVRRDSRFEGRSKLATVVDELVDDGSDSGFEFRTRARLARLGIHVDRDQLEVRTGRGHRRLDLALRDLGIGVECHSFRYHGDRQAMDADAARMNDLREAGDLAILHLTWSMQYGEPWGRFLGTLCRVMRSRGYDGPLPR